MRAGRAVIRAFVRERLAPEHPDHHIDRFGEAFDAPARRRHRHADRVVFRLVPTGTETDVEAASAHSIKRGQRLGEYRRRPQRFAENERSEANAGHAPRERRERDDRLEARFPVGRTAVLREVEKQMVGQPHRLEARRGCQLRVPGDGRELQRSFARDRVVVLRKREPELHRRGAYRSARRLVDVIETVVNISEGRDLAALRAVADRCGDSLIDVHIDADHNRSVYTLAGPGRTTRASATRDLADAVAAHISIADHDGVHPYLGALDVVPFVALGGTKTEKAQAGEYARAFGNLVGGDARGAGVLLRRRGPGRPGPPAHSPPRVPVAPTRCGPG